MDLRDELMEAWVAEYEKLEGLDYSEDPERYKLQMQRVSDLERRMIELNEAELNKEIQLEGAEKNRKNEKRKSVVEILKTVIPAAGAFAMGLISMKWEKTDTLTSTAGKSSLRESTRFRW